MNQRAPVFLRDYQPPAFQVAQLDLTIRIFPAHTQVLAKMRLEQTPGQKNRNLRLYGRGLKLLSLKREGKELQETDYEVDAEGLILKNCPLGFELETQVEIDPERNTALEGLYRSSGNYCTQCEPEGFRRITYYPDRPDVMTLITTRIEADQDIPVLLSNGNCVEKGELAEGRHFATWQDPFAKPAYLFALVAGNLVCHRDAFTTFKGKKVILEIWVEPANQGRTEHAMKSLKQAMQWDEEIYGREYDLDIYMIVAVNDFNMGAMENKGLNIFNSSCILANPATATDKEFENIQGIIAHEYFHNWTGNRVTLRDWFQLSLKEGLTIFRDQSFTQDLNSAALARIEDVKLLRAHQFPEDEGPMRHPVRPDHFI